MKGSELCHLSTKENIIFSNDFYEISQKISQILPFSKIAVLCFLDEYFSFYQQFKQTLLQSGLKVIDIIVSDNFSAEKERLDDFLSLPEDVRGVIAFNRKLMPLILSNYLNGMTAFFIINNQDCFGVVQNYYYFRERDLIKKIQKNSNAYIVINNQNQVIEGYIKSACLYVHMLIDYIFRQSLFKENMDMRFINKVKSILIDLLLYIKSGQIENEKAIENLLFVEEYLVKKECFYSCSGVISCFLANDNFFDVDYCLVASKKIIDRYEKAFNKKMKKGEVDYKDYNEIAKTLCFVMRLNQNDLLRYLDSKIKIIDTKALSTIKQEIQKLILLYNDFKKLIKESSTVGGNLKKQTLNLCISLSGYTPFGVNGITAL